MRILSQLKNLEDSYFAEKDLVATVDNLRIGTNSRHNLVPRVFPLEVEKRDLANEVVPGDLSLDFAVLVRGCLLYIDL